MRVDSVNQVVQPTKRFDPPLVIPNLARTTALLAGLEREVLRIGDVVPPNVCHGVGVKPETPELFFNLVNLIVGLLSFELLVEVEQNVVPPCANIKTKGVVQSFTPEVAG